MNLQRKFRIVREDGKIRVEVFSVDKVWVETTMPLRPAPKEIVISKGTNDYDELVKIREEMRGKPLDGTPADTKWKPMDIYKEKANKKSWWDIL